MVDELKDYSGRLAEAMADATVSTSALAGALKVSYQAVRKVLEGGRFGMQNHAKAAKYLNVEPEWLATGRGPKRHTGVQAVSVAELWPPEEVRRKAMLLEAPELSRLENLVRVYLNLPLKRPASPVEQPQQSLKGGETPEQPRATLRNKKTQEAGKLGRGLREAVDFPEEGDGSTQDQRAPREEGGGRA